MSKSTQDARLAGEADGVGQPFVDQALLDCPPMAEEELMFFPIAIAVAGKALDPRGWQDWERTVEYYPAPAPRGLTLMTFGWLEQANAPKAPPPVPISSTSGARYNVRARQSAYEEEKQRWENEKPQRKAAFQKEMESEGAYLQQWAAGHLQHATGEAELAKALRAVCQKITDQKITPYGRPVSGGATYKLKRELFMMDTPPMSLVRKGILLTDRQVANYVFLPKAEVHAAFGSGMLNRQEGEGPAVSPYLQLMLHVAAKQAITQSNSSTVDSLQSDLWDCRHLFGLDDDADFSPSLAKSLAGAIRWPDARKGKGKGKGKGRTQKT